MLAPVRQITDDTSSRTVCTWGCALIGQLSCRGNFRSEGPHVTPVLPWQQHDGGGRWLLTCSVCVCVCARSQPHTDIVDVQKSDCDEKNCSDFISQSAPLPWHPFCCRAPPSARSAWRLRAHCSLMQNEIICVHFYPSNKHEQFLMFLMFRVYFLSEAERGGWWEDRVNQTVDRRAARVISGFHIKRTSSQHHISTITSSFSENVQKQFFMFTGVTEEDAGTGGEPCQELQHCDGWNLCNTKMRV